LERARRRARRRGGAERGLIFALRPQFARYAMARPNARSSHKLPTPQGGGIAVVAATLAAIWLGVRWARPFFTSVLRNFSRSR
jgi:UDP-N-acetylmuramyl pentapeptide phosphotransferase/UDP-N-acetylglucosamine-1-phosphate transferase